MYVSGVAVHLLDLSTRSDVVLALPRQGRSIDVDLTPDGLFYGYEAPYTRQPGRLGFVPLDALRAGVSR